MFVDCLKSKEVDAFLISHYGFSSKKKTLGKGAFSLVFSVGRSSVLKLSADPYWYLLMKYLQEKQCEHVPEFLVDHGVIAHVKYEFNGQIIDLPVYAVEMPKYAFPKRDTSNYNMQCWLHANRDKSLDESVLSTKMHIKKFCKLSKHILRELAKKEKLNSWVTDLNISLSIDMHNQNIMEDKKGNLIFLDPVFCYNLFKKIET